MNEHHRLRQPKQWGESKMRHCICSRCRRRRRLIKDLLTATWPGHAAEALRQNSPVLDALAEDGYQTTMPWGDEPQHP